MTFTRPTTLLVCATLCSGVLLSSSAFAQSKDDIKRAKQSFIKGRKALKDKDNKEAIKLFTEAFTLSKRAAILFYVGQAYDQDGQLLEARKYYQQYLDKVPDASNAEDVLDTILKLQQRIRKEYALVEIKTAKPGRDVFIDKESEARCRTKSDAPCRITLKPGRYAFVLKAGSGNKVPDLKKMVTLSAGDKKAMALELKALDSATLLVKSDVDSATLKVGSKTIELPMSAPVKLKPGNYPLVVKKADGTAWTGDVTVEQDKLAQIYVPLKHASAGGGGTSIIRTVSYALLGTGAGLLIGGIWMGSQTNSTFDKLEKQKQAGSIDNDLVEQGQSQQFAANTLLVTGTLAVLGGGGLFAWDFFSSQPDKAEPSEGSEDPPPKKKVPEPTPDDELL